MLIFTLMIIRAIMQSSGLPQVDHLNTVTVSYKKLHGEKNKNYCMSQELLHESEMRVSLSN